MKISIGFISNSSSSSFVCEICGRTESGWDIGLSEYEFVRCVNDHIFCEDEILDVEPPSENPKEYEDEIPECQCPICNFSEPSYPDLKRYFLKISKVTEEEVFQEIKKINKRRRVLKPHEYVEYVLRTLEKTVDQVLNEFKDTFKTYSEFRKFLNKEKS